jgi:tetratricopeptide (TPR) repeat protein
MLIVERPLSLPRLNVPLARNERPVELVELNVSVEVSGALAVTTWELLFDNPNRRILEGQLEFPLLDGQTIVRFAMDVNGSLREAVPVPKDKGRQVFEDITRRQVDPGLLERTAGNSYRARIYPLLPGQRKRVLIGYQEELRLHDGAPVYQLALDFPVLRRFSLHLAVRGPSATPVVAKNTLGLALSPWREDFVTRAEKTDFAARGLLAIALPPGERPAITTETFKERTYFRAEQAVAPRTRARPAPRVLGLLWDSSGSGDGRDLDREFAALERYFQALPGPLEVRLVRLRDVPEATEVFRVERGQWSELRRALELTSWDGATALDSWKPEAGVDAWLLCTDGLINFGDPKARPDTGSAPVHVLLSAARADPGRLRALADRSGGEFLNLLEVSAQAAVERLLSETERLLSIETSPREVAQVFPEAPSPLRGQRLVLAGVLRTRQATVRVRMGFPDEPASARTLDVPVRAEENMGHLAARAWAALKLAALEPMYELNQEDIEHTGREFGIVTRSTSLIILETVEDYARYDIEPPPELRDAWERLRQSGRHQQQQERAQRLEHVRALFQDYVDWWNRDFPKDGPRESEQVPSWEDGLSRAAAPARSAARPLLDDMEVLGSPSLDSLDSELAEDEMPMLSEPEPYAMDDLAAEAPAEAYAEEVAMDDEPPPPMAAPAPAMAAPAPASRVSADALDSGEGAPSRGPAASIRLKKWTPDAPYLDRFRRTPDARLYHVYLEERPDYARSTAFFLDAADVFFERNQPALGLRVLSNLAEMELENPAVLRILGYRLLQAGRPDLAHGVFVQVKELRPEEPQSYRDLSQACAALGRYQEAVDLLWEVVQGEWDSRFPEVQLIALVELNALVATCGQPLDLSRIDARLLRHMPLELRVVLTWDADNTDIDLWVTDPNGEKGYYGQPLTFQGGRMSRDFRSGYGPEVFSLRHAQPGEYTVEANYYGNSQQIIAGATTLQLQFITHFGTPRQKEERVTLRLREAREVVTVGQFVMGGNER